MNRRLFAIVCALALTGIPSRAIADRIPLSVQVGMPFPGPGTPHGGGSTPTFAHVAGSNGTNSNNGGAVTIGVTLGHTPATGQIVLCNLSFVVGVTPTGITLKDSNNNSYTVGPNSPATNAALAFSTYTFHLSSAPSNATATLTAAWTNSQSFEWLACDIFTDSGVSQVFDTDAVSTNATSTVTTGAITVPSLTPATTGELLYCGVLPNDAIISPTAGSTQGVFTGAVIDGLGPGAEYALSISGATAANFTDNSGLDPIASACQAMKP